MLEEENLAAPRCPMMGCRPRIRSAQVSLAELFFMTTLAAVGIGVYVYISPLLALICGGALLVAGVVRWMDCQNLISGGLTGFVASILLCYGIVVLTGTDMILSIGLGLLGPAAGYVWGACLAELSNDGSL